MRKGFLLLLTGTLLIQGCKKQETVEVQKGRVEEITINVDPTLAIVTPKALVYLPPNYDENKSYPVIYMLHGFGGDYRTYVYFNGVHEILDYLISTGQIDPAIVVMPDGRNLVGGSFYTNSYLYDPSSNSYGAITVFGKYETYIVDSLMAQVERTYPIDTTHRAIMGLSMGSYGSSKLWLKYPGRFKAVALHSGPLAFDSLIDVDIIDSMLSDFEDRKLPLWIKDYLGRERIWATLGNGLSAAFSPRIVLYQDPSDWRVIENCFYSPNGLDSINGEVLLDTVSLGSSKLCVGVRFPFTYDTVGKPLASCIDPALPDNFTKRSLTETYCLWKAYHDPQTLIDTAIARDNAGFLDTKVYIDVGKKDELTLLYHNRGFKQALIDRGFPASNLVYVEFDGAIGYPAEYFPGLHSTWLYIRLKKSFKFIDRVFKGEDIKAGEYDQSGGNDYE
ncbi:MAG: hypothetical protein GXO39_01465 [Thermotogae bacterium]|nr:hypothetical protein [Thermotogota bacterium]